MRMNYQVGALAVAVMAGLLSPRHLAASETMTFVHPGLLHTQTDLARMKARVAQGAEPWKSGFERLRSHPQSQSDWRLRGPFRSVSRGPRGSLHINEMDQDANAAYQNALMVCHRPGRRTPKKALEILDAWSATLEEIVGKDKELGASLGGFKFVNAAEIMRHTYPGWQPSDRERCQRMFRNVFYPVIKDFATFANGNWDTGCIKTMMGIGVFCDDRTIFDRAVAYYRQGAGNGRLTHYIINVQGQCQESGRDQQHTQLGLGHLAEACEIAWNQGLDLYAADDNRLRKGFEYTAKYNLGQDVPFVPYADTTGKNKSKMISPEGRGDCVRFTRWSGTTTRTVVVFRRRIRDKPPRGSAPKARPGGQIIPVSARSCSRDRT